MYNYDHDCPLEAYITNLGKYNEEELVGEWVKLPTTYEYMQAVFQRIGIDGVRYEEWSSRIMIAMLTTSIKWVEEVRTYDLYQLKDIPNRRDYGSSKLTIVHFIFIFPVSVG